eukprot:6188139-Pleurochrysis_carterae.AAC.1
MAVEGTSSLGVCAFTRANVLLLRARFASLQKRRVHAALVSARVIAPMRRRASARPCLPCLPERSGPACAPMRP